ncbi:hypothetical protein M5K25_024188 [Dendrobium thyrsiflorum]|uniref:Uncharacterized protein n=1 Tax=Dendrobium thyrsiflorum TaxID=117978 RepID=A0ABD0U179_DENTH
MSQHYSTRFCKRVKIVNPDSTRAGYRVDPTRPARKRQWQVGSGISSRTAVVAACRRDDSGTVAAPGLDGSDSLQLFAVCASIGSSIVWQSSALRGWDGGTTAGRQRQLRRDVGRPIAVIGEGLVECVNSVSGPLPSPWSGEKGRRVLCPHRGVVKKEELRFSAGERKKGSLPSPWSGEKGRVAVLCRGKEEGFSAFTVEWERAKETVNTLWLQRQPSFRKGLSVFSPVFGICKVAVALLSRVVSIHKRRLQRMAAPAVSFVPLQPSFSSAAPRCGVIFQQVLVPGHLHHNLPLRKTRIFFPAYKLCFQRQRIAYAYSSLFCSGCLSSFGEAHGKEGTIIEREDCERGSDSCNCIRTKAAKAKPEQ